MDVWFERACQFARITDLDLKKKLFKIFKQLLMDKRDCFEWQWHLIFLSCPEVILIFLELI